MEDLTRILNEQESFLKGIYRETDNLNTNCNITSYPKGYLGVQKQVRDITIIGRVIGKEIGYSGNNIKKAYAKTRAYLNEKILGRKKPSIEELLNIQLRNMVLLNSNLKYINEEAREERNNLIEYYEAVCEEFKHNILTAPERQRRLKIKTEEFRDRKQKLRTMKGYDEMYFRTEKIFREARRSQAEEEHDYAIRIRDTINLQQEKSFLDIMEQLLTKSVHLSEVYNREIEHIGRHVEKTKNVYLRLLEQQGHFFVLKECTKKLEGHILNLQKGIVNGLGEMNAVVNGVDPLGGVYSSNMGSLKSIIEDVKNANNERNLEFEKSLTRDKLFKG